MTNFPRFNSLEDRLKRMADRLKALEMRPGGGSGLGATGPYARRERSSTQSIPSSSWTVIALNINDRTQGGFSWNNNALVVPRDGIYLISGALRWASNSNGGRGTGLYVGEDRVSFIFVGSSSTTANPMLPVSTTAFLSEGDRVSLRAYQQSGSSLGLGVVAPKDNYLSVALL